MEVYGVYSGLVISECVGEIWFMLFWVGLCS